MDATNRDQEVAVSVYEAIDREPAWQVRMRHVIVEPTREGLNVTEMISVFNPTDRAWTGRAAGTGAPVTLELALPPTTTCLKAGGAFREGHVKVENGKLFCLMPLLPGGADFQVHYMIPAMDNDRARGPAVGAGGDEQSLRVPPAGRHRRHLRRAQTGRGQAGGAAQGGFPLLHGPPQNAGDVIRFTVSGLKALKAPDSGLAPRQGGSHPGAGRASSGIPGAAKIAGAVGAGAILTVGTAIILFKSPKTAGAKA